MPRNKKTVVTARAPLRRQDGTPSPLGAAGPAGPVGTGDALRVVATGVTRTIANLYSLVVVDYIAVEGTGVLAIEGDGALAIT